jgi:hypothetical protein
MRSIRMRRGHPYPSARYSTAKLAEFCFVLDTLLALAILIAALQIWLDGPGR